MSTFGVYSVTVESVSDKPLAKLLEELLVETMETELPYLGADNMRSL